MTNVSAYAALEAGLSLTPYNYHLPALEPEQLDIKVEYCGICHSDLSMLSNDWGMSQYPLIAGHEVIGIVEAVGEHVKGLKVGQRVGLGWFSGSCMHCYSCMSGHHNLCATAEQTVVGRHGGFADRVRCHQEWAFPLPDHLAAESAGPLFCGGITVFNPIIQCNVLPTNRVGVIGIGGLGHLALQFLNKWGCEVTAFTSSNSKANEAKKLGAHHVVNSTDSAAMSKLANSYDFILNTTNVTLDWNAYLSALKPLGKFHNVGAVLEPMAIPAFSLITGQKSVSGSPLGSPATISDMLEFCARHAIAPVIETYPMQEINKALQHLHAGKARYRVVLVA
ncbi:MAG: NADPH-dependent aldehyde reductase Ahr [Alphaproteobacteria bacterium]